MDFYGGFLFLISITDTLAGSQLTEIKLFKSMKTWNDAVEFCRNNGMTLLEIRTPQKAEAVRRVEDSNIWQNQIQDFWIGLHDPNPSNEYGYSWVEDCEPQDSWGDWYTNEPLNYGSDKCIKVERDGFRWRTGPCNQANMVMCEQAVGECYFDTVSGKSSSVVGILQSVASLEDCKTACLNMEADVNGECWAFTYVTPLLCYTHRVSNMFHYDTVANLASWIGATLYIKRCFQGALETTQDNSVVSNVNEPQTGCVEGESSRSESSTTTTTLTTNLPTTSASAFTPSSTTFTTTTTATTFYNPTTSTVITTPFTSPNTLSTLSTTSTAASSADQSSTTTVTSDTMSAMSTEDASLTTGTTLQTATTITTAQSETTVTTDPTAINVTTDPTATTVITDPIATTVITDPATATVTTDPATDTDPNETSATTDPITTTTTTDPTATTVTKDPTATTATTDPNATIPTTDPTATTDTTDPITTTVTTNPTATTVTTDPTATTDLNDTISTTDPAVTTVTSDQTSTISTRDLNATADTSDPNATTITTDPAATTVTTDPTATTASTDPALSTSTSTPAVTVATQTTSVTNTGISITTVTSSSSSTSNVSEVCGCRCHQSENLTLDERVLKIFKELLVNKKTTSKSLRAKTSAPDERPSAQNIGYSGVALIVVTGLLIVLGDADRFFSLFGKRRR